jgi:hypothetical protein
MRYMANLRRERSVRIAPITFANGLAFGALPMGSSFAQEARNVREVIMGRAEATSSRVQKKHRDLAPPA